MKRIKLPIVLSIVLCLFFLTSISYGVGKDGLVLNVLQDGQVMKELSGEVALPFHSEYKLRLRNINDRRAAARVFIDGIQVSILGDFVIPANGMVDLERFLDRSLMKGKRFKFVSVLHPEVNDPYSAQNGEIRVEIRLERKLPGVLLKSENIIIPPVRYSFDGDKVTLDLKRAVDLSNTLSITDSIASFMNSSVNCSAGATIGGSYSNQAFHSTWFDIEDSKVELQLKLVGMNP